MQGRRTTTNTQCHSIPPPCLTHTEAHWLASQVVRNHSLLAVKVGRSTSLWESSLSISPGRSVAVCRAEVQA